MEGLVALYRSNAAGVSSTVFPSLWVDPQDRNKMIAIRACEAILAQGRKLPWFASLDELRQRDGPVARTVFKVGVLLLVSDTGILTHRRVKSPIFSPTALVPDDLARVANTRHSSFSWSF